MKLKISLGLLSLAMLATTAALHERPGFAQDALAEPSAEPVPSTEPATTYTSELSADAAPRPTEPVAVNATPAAEAPVGIVTGQADPEPNPFAETTHADLSPLAMARHRREPSLQEAAAAVRDAQDDEARSAATERLRELLNKTFDADMQRREQELVRIEQRLQTLREQHARRMEKKDEIIELQTRVLLNEAEGLGFHSSAEPIFGYEGATRAPAVYFRSELSPSYPRQAQPAVPGRAPATNVPRPAAK